MLALINRSKTILQPEDQWSCKRSLDIWAKYKLKTYKTWSKQGQEMTSTLKIHLLSFTELVIKIYKFPGHWLQQFLKYPLFSCRKAKITKFDLAVKYVKVTSGSSFEYTMVSRSPRCYIPSFVEIGQPVPIKKIFERFLPYMGMAAILVM